MVPMFLIIPIFVVAFLLCAYQYYRVDPQRRLLNVRFGLMLGATICAFGYPVYNSQHPGDWRVSWGLLVLAIFWLGASYYLLRRIPPADID